MFVGQTTGVNILERNQNVIMREVFHEMNEINSDMKKVLVENEQVTKLLFPRPALGICRYICTLLQKRGLSPAPALTTFSIFLCSRD